MYIPEIRFLNSGDLPEILKINSLVPYSWPDEVIEQDFEEIENNKNNSGSSSGDVSYIGAFGTTLEAPLLGYAVLGSENHYGVLMYLIVQDQYSRMGIATQLILAVSECAEYLKYKKIKLRVRKSNFKAISLYQKMSFVKESIIQEYYSNGEDAFVMSAKIPIQFHFSV